MTKEYKRNVWTPPKVTHVDVTEYTPQAKNKKLTGAIYTSVLYNKDVHIQRHPSLLHAAIYLATLNPAHELLGVGALAGTQVHWDQLGAMTF